MNREALEARARELGVQFAPNIVDAKLAERVAKAEAEQAKVKGDATPQHAPPAEKASGGADPSAPSEAAQGEVLRVTGPRKGRWRAGRHFTREPVDLPLSELTDAEIAAITADPLLSVEHVTAD